MIRRGYFWTLVVVVGLLAIAPMASADPGDRIDRLVVAQENALETLNPILHVSRTNLIVDDNIFDSLLRRAPDNELVPWLAESFERIDEFTWEFKLRPGIKFHNGNPLDAASVAFTLQQYGRPDSPRATDFGVVEDVEIIDDLTGRIITSESYPTLPNRLMLAAIVDHRYHQEYGDDYVGQHPVGTGPFKFVSWDPGERLVLERNEDYWAHDVMVERVDFIPIEETSTRVNALLSGEIDIATFIPPHMWPQLDMAPNVRLSTSIGGRPVSVVLNVMGYEPVQDVRVRQALNYAIDKETLHAAFLEGSGYITGQPSSPQIFGYNPEVQPYPYDPDRARELLAEAGYADGFELEIEIGRGMALNDVQIVEAVVAQLQDVGIDARVRVREWTDMIETITSHRVRHAYLLSWGGFSTFDLSTYVEPLFTPGAGFSMWPDEGWLAMNREAGAAIADDDRLAVYKDISAYFHEQAAHIYLWVQPNTYGVNSDINWEARPDELIPLHYTERSDRDPMEVFMEQSEQLPGN